MKTFDFNLEQDINHGKISAFSYSHSLNELVGSWSASVAGGTFKAGEAITFEGVMTNGIISKARKDSSGLWRIEGYDAGVRLMRSTPEISDLPEGDAKTVISRLATFCNIQLVMNNNGLSGFNVRSVISGSTCAEAILELAMLSGFIAFIGNDGKLYVQAPADKPHHSGGTEFTGGDSSNGNNDNTFPIEGHSNPNLNFSYIIDDSGSDIDLDGYATQVSVILTRKSEDIDADDDGESGGTIYYTGQTPSLSPYKVTTYGLFSNGTYSFTMLEPFGVVESLDTTITENSVTVHTVENHSYDYKVKTIWRDNQEYALFAFIEKAYTLTKTITGEYSTEAGEKLTFTETTTENMNRSFSVFDDVGVHNDWEGQISMIDTETITRSTVREGGEELQEGMPSYSPPFDVQITRKYSRDNRGQDIICNETEISYEARQVGSISPVKVNGELVPYFMTGSSLAIQTHSTPAWVEVITYRTYYEKRDDNGECIISTRSEYCDEGSKWLVAHALDDTGDDDINELQKAYAKFTQQSHGLDVSIGQSVISSPWNFIELQGRMMNTTADDEEGVALGNVSEWYNNGNFLPHEVCPFYNKSAQECNVFLLGNLDEEKECRRVQGTYFWKACARAMAALRLARELEAQQVEAPIIGTASLSNVPDNNPTLGYTREVYVDETLTDDEAQSIADAIAANILTIKGLKGIRRTVTIPYSPSYVPDGAVVEVSHDWENLTTSVTYRDEGDIPDFLVAQSVSGIAAFVAAREASKLSVPKYGVISTIQNEEYKVKVGNSEVFYTTKLQNLAEGDNVLVSFQSGNKLRGQVIARL
ncbi:MAG: hypothetical protein IJG36_01040 [Synergistaceae bacterium]|nr:hypothetical protein [Synergistaceae bacterium]MBR0248652.1 hypothetical protein [Synergistaceae bacterium]